MTLKERVAAVKSEQKYILTLSILDEKGKSIDHFVESNHFLTNDIPIARNEISKLLGEIYIKETTQKSEMEIQKEQSEQSIKGILE
jgi:hypothetical protein